MYIGFARGSEPVSHPAQRRAVDESIVPGGGDGPAVVPREGNTAAVRRLRARRRRGKRRQRRATEQRNELAPFHSILSFTAFAAAYQMILPAAIASSPLPLWERVDRMSASSFETGEGFSPRIEISLRIETPHPALRATFSHKGRRKMRPPPAAHEPFGPRATQRLRRSPGRTVTEPCDEIHENVDERGSHGAGPGAQRASLRTTGSGKRPRSKSIKAFRLWKIHSSASFGQAGAGHAREGYRRSETREFAE